MRAPQVEVKSHLKDKFWADMVGLIQGKLPTEKIFIWDDLNGHNSKEARSHAKTYSCFGFEELNEDWQTIIHFSWAYNLKIVNIF